LIEITHLFTAILLLDLKKLYGFYLGSNFIKTGRAKQFISFFATFFDAFPSFSGVTTTFKKHLDIKKGKCND
jgi:hypothetical protein